LKLALTADTGALRRVLRNVDAHQSRRLPDPPDSRSDRRGQDQRPQLYDRFCFSGYGTAHVFASALGNIERQ
jgi:hypothetical protein